MNSISSLAWSATDRLAEVLDFFRSRALRFTLRIEWLRPVFHTRHQRLLALFLLSLAGSLPLALFFPLWVLLFGPLLYGVPHLFSSIRYFHYSVRERSRSPLPDSRQGVAYGFAVFLLICVCFYRLVQTGNALHSHATQLSEWKGSNYLDLAALLLTFVGGSIIYRRTVGQFARGAALLAPFVAAFTFNAAWTIGAMVLMHNFIAFVYWLRAARSPAEKRVAISALITTLGLSALIFAGGFDSLIQANAPHVSLGFARLTAEATGKLIAPWWSGSPTFWLHATIAYAFGQALHYFVWLKAIPDQFHGSEVPTSFRQMFRLLSNDFGKSAALAVIALSAGSIVVWSFLSFEKARLIYFCLAAYHGYLEIAGLALSTGNHRQNSAPYFDALSASLAHESFSVTARLNTGRPGLLSCRSATK